MAKATVTVKYFQFTQNNSGGYFTGPAHYVIVEAVSATMANQLAVEYGVDKDAPYCHCCGRRWSLLFRDEAGDAVPSLYGETLKDEDYKLVKQTSKYDFDDLVLVVYMDGRQEYYAKG